MRRQSQSGSSQLTEGAMDKIRLGRTDLMVTSDLLRHFGPRRHARHLRLWRRRDARQGDAPRHFRRAGQFHRHGAQLWAGPQRRAARRRHSRARRSSARFRHLDQARSRFRDEQIRRLARAALARAKPEGARRRPDRPPASARSRARELVRRGDRQGRRARRTVPHQGGGPGEGGGARGRARPP